jgi:hypothetical protein
MRSLLSRPSKKVGFIDLPGEIRNSVYLEYLKISEKHVDWQDQPCEKETILALYELEEGDNLPPPDIQRWGINIYGENQYYYLWTYNKFHLNGFISVGHWAQLCKILALNKQIRYEMLGLLVSMEYFKQCWVLQNDDWSKDYCLQSAFHMVSGILQNRPVFNCIRISWHDSGNWYKVCGQIVEGDDRKAIEWMSTLQQWNEPGIKYPPSDPQFFKRTKYEFLDETQSLVRTYFAPNGFVFAWWKDPLSKDKEQHYVWVFEADEHNDTDRQKDYYDRSFGDNRKQFIEMVKNWKWSSLYHDGKWDPSPGQT